MKLLKLLPLLFLCTGQAFSQDLQYKYSDLSSVYYKRTADSLKKAWICPVLYKDKQIQKDFCEQWTGRTAFLNESINDNSFIYQPLLSQYVEAVVDRLYNANKTLFKKKPLVLLDRSPSVNAYSIGGDIIVANIGLLAYVHSRDELAMVIGHELGHNILEHVQRSMQHKAEWLNSDEYKDFIKDITNDRYNRVTKIRAAYKEFSYNRNRHSRYGESAADSMAVQMLQKASFAFDAKWFLRLDSSDLVYKTALKRPIAAYFLDYGIAIPENYLKKKSIGLSSKVADRDFSKPIDDSLKTHPDTELRFLALQNYTADVAKATAMPSALTVLAEKDIIWNLYRTNNFTSALYRLFLLKDHGISDQWTDFMMANLFTSFYAEDAMLNRSNVIRVKTQNSIGKDYFSLQTLLEQLPSEEFRGWSEKANAIPLEATGANERRFRSVLKSIAANPESYKYARKKEKAEIMDGLSNNIYAEYFY